MNNFSFTPADGLRDKNSFPTRPANEEEARSILQTPSDQLKDYINTNVVNNADKPWQDIFLSGVSKNINGYNKLPNGMLIQWGLVTLTFENEVHKNVDITLPTSFNNVNYIVIANPKGQLGVTCGCHAKSWGVCNIWATESTKTPFTANIPIQYIALGY